MACLGSSPDRRPLRYTSPPEGFSLVSLVHSDGYYRLSSLNNNFSFLPSQSWRLEIQDQGASWFNFWWGFISWFSGVPISLCAHMVEREMVSLLFLLVRALITFMKALSSWLNFFPKTLPLYVITMKIKPSVYEFWREYTHLVHSSICC